VNVLKSLVDWEKSHRQSEKQSKGGNSLDEEVSAKDLTEIESREAGSSDFEKAKAHKSTMEAAITLVNLTTNITISVFFKVTSKLMCTWLFAKCVSAPEKGGLVLEYLRYGKLEIIRLPVAFPLLVVLVLITEGREPWMSMTCPFVDQGFLSLFHMYTVMDSS